MPTIAYLGPEKTNTHVAAQKKFGRRAKYVHAPTVDEVFHFVERQKADYGVVPIENSLEGAVTHTLDRFLDFKHSPVTIHGEIEQPVKHYLIIHQSAKVTDIRALFSHPQALAQCQHWVAQHLAKVRWVETNSTAEAVNEVLNENVTVWSGGEGIRRGEEPEQRAAIARKELVEGKPLQAIPIPEHRENKTRFLVLGLGEPRRSPQSKTSILFSLKDRPGALYDALVPFKRERINLTKIESRPSKQKAWEYYFFIDVEGHGSEPRLKRALAALKRSALFMRVLGSYPMDPR